MPDKFRPIYKVVIRNPDSGKQYEFNPWFCTFDKVQHKSISKLTIYIDRNLETPLDMFRIRIATGSGSLRNAISDIIKVDEIKLGATVKIYLGYNTRLEDSFSFTPDQLVFTGLVDNVAKDLKNIVITGYSNAYKIIFKKPEGKAFNAETPKVKSSKNIIFEMLKNTTVIVDRESKYFDKGMTYESYVPDVEKSIYDNIKQLADISGYDFYFSRDGRLRFHDTKKEGGKNLEYAVDIIDNSIESTRPPYDKIIVQVVHEDVQKGEKAWTYSAEPVEGTSGGSKSGIEKIEKTIGIIKEMEDAKKVATNKMNAMYKTKSGQVTILGNPGLDLCQIINLKFADSSVRNAPGAKELDDMKQDNVQITRITHKFNMKSGFVTVVGWAGAGWADSKEMGFGHILLSKKSD